jgi:sigma-B regulation protein RsbU (phosphoserine phosphatase)
MEGMKPCPMTRGSNPTTCEEADRELSGLGEAQRLLLPPALPDIDGVEVDAAYQPSSRAGGDYYDFFELSYGRWGFLIADVSGHGAQAALGMAIVHAAARASPVKESPAALLGWLNSQLAGGGFAGRTGSFVTAFYAVLDLATGEFRYSSAGHNPPRLRRGETVRALDEARSLPLGILAEETYVEASMQLEKDNAVIFYTDGITEARDERGGFFGVERLDHVIASSCGAAPAINEAVLQALRRFTGSRRREDDRTLLALTIAKRRRPLA